MAGLVPGLIGTSTMEISQFEDETMAKCATQSAQKPSSLPTKGLAWADSAGGRRALARLPPMLHYLD